MLFKEAFFFVIHQIRCFSKSNTKLKELWLTVLYIRYAFFFLYMVTAWANKVSKILNSTGCIIHLVPSLRASSRVLGFRIFGGEEVGEGKERELAAMSQKFECLR